MNFNWGVIQLNLIYLFFPFSVKRFSSRRVWRYVGDKRPKKEVREDGANWKKEKNQSKLDLTIFF